MRYGPRLSQTPRAGFLGSLLCRGYPLGRGFAVLSGLAPDVSAVRLWLPPFNALFRLCARASLLRHRWGSRTGGNGILTVCPSTLSFRMRVRSRLTLIRLALIRNPWSSGEGVSRPLCRYLYLHLLLTPLHRISRHGFGDGVNAPLPIILMGRFHVFGTGLMPDYYPCGTTRLVSCYALFK